MYIELVPELAEAWQGQDVFEVIQALDGEVFKAKDNRVVKRFYLDGKAYFLKFHRGVGWREIFHNLFQLKLPVLGAENEWRAINRLHELNVSTMDAVGFGRKGINPAGQLSFLITRELADSITLERLCEQWGKAPPSFLFKQRLIAKMAEIARLLREGGVNHRDFYICHFLLNLEDCSEGDELPTISVVDLHRAQTRKTVPLRWLVKDIGSLYFSALDVGLTRGDVLRFMALYMGKSVKQTLIEDRAFWVLVQKRAINLYKKAYKREPVLHLSRLEA